MLCRESRRYRQVFEMPSFRANETAVGASLYARCNSSRDSTIGFLVSIRTIYSVFTGLSSGLPRVILSERRKT